MVGFCAPGVSFCGVMPVPLFRSFFQGGFECSGHRRRSGRRVDVIDATRHDHFAREDYARLAAAGLLTARDGLRWPLIERVPGEYEFGSVAAQVAGSREAGVQVIWDLLHYGTPDHVDVFAPDFPARFAAFAAAAARYLGAQTDGELWLCPINEVSFFAWGGGEVGYLNPFVHGRGPELKRSLVRAVIAGMDAVRALHPGARFLHAEPLIAVSADPDRPWESEHAAGVQESQFEALDLLSGRLSPELGGGPQYLDVLGLNYYPDNQWRHHPDHGQRRVLPPGHAAYRPLRTLLAEMHVRYDRPLLISETGAEDDARAPWFAGVAREALAARAAGVPVHGVCLYPVVNHPGWDDDRHCHNGLWDYPDTQGGRSVHLPLLEALRTAQAGERGDRTPGAARPGNAPAPGDALAEALRRFAGAERAVRAEAAARDADAQVPGASLAALHAGGLLGVTLPGPDGGLGLAGVDLLHLLRRVGRASLPVARLYEGHVNALLLTARYGTPAQARQAAADVHAGHVFGVWNTEDGDGLHLHAGENGWTLRGGKTFTSGGAAVTRALVTAERPDGGGRQLLLLGQLDAARFDASFWQPLGMRATASARLTLDGLPVPADTLIGLPGDYYAQPEFGGGALRFLAAQLGGADALVDAARDALQQLGRAGDPAQALRFADAAGRAEGAWQIVLEGARRLERGETGEALLAYVSLARAQTEDACLLVAEATERAVGARGLLEPNPAARLLRDLRMYLRQPAPDAARLAAGHWLLGRPGPGAEDISSWRPS